MNYRQSEAGNAVIVQPADIRATASVVWLHGLGADGHDFAPIVPRLPLPETLAVRFVFPHAPLRAVTINQGMRMRAWYDIASRGGGLVEDGAGIAASTALVADYLQRESDSGIAHRRIVLAGFSQGGAIALHAGLRSAIGLGGIMGLSTYLPLRDQAGAQLASANRATPILLCHGREDTVLPFQLGETARDSLRALGFAVQWRAYVMGHEVCAEEIADVAAWLAGVLA